jgi:hypothetical protein
MKFQAKTKKEIDEVDLWEKGKYAFEILDASDEVSKSGKEMIKLKVKIFTDTGKSQVLFDYLLPDVMEFKLRHIAEATDLLKDYETGELTAYQFISKIGYCKVGHTKATADYPTVKNQINDYVVDGAPPATLKEAIGSDEIPF